ncbi:MAG: sugar ABC transporter ATP-binding protein [Alphaproteobacteria bacterium]|nr:MAG: sugar ABC transporter ATP-binding protein [Alphaproteobacteria bacterium]
MAGIELRALHKRFGTTDVVRGIDLTVPSGAFLTLLGPSGCGKSTLLRMLAGLEAPSAGQILFDGSVVNDIPPGRRDIAMVFQSYALYPHMTVAQNIAYPLRKRGVPRGERDAAVARAAEVLQLTALLDRRPRELSGGQQQRVALGRALVREPRIFLLDEPLSNLDATLRSHMRRELVALHRRIGRTMVYVTHDQLEAMTMSTHVAVIDGGRLQQFGTPAEVYRRPANRMVASFIGTPGMAFADGMVATGRLLLAGRPLALIGAPDGPVTVGIRAEDVEIADTGVAACVTDMEAVGHETLLTLSGEFGTVTARAPADCRLAPGATVHWQVRPAQLHLFNPETGDRRNAALSPITSSNETTAP